MKQRGEILLEIDRAVFRTITDDDWARELLAARSKHNAIRDRITEILAQKQPTKLIKDELCHPA